MTVDHAPPLVVVDTDVVSIIHNKDRDERAPYYETALAGRRLLVSFQTLEEIRYGMLDRGWGVKRRNEMERHLDQYEIAWPDRRTATASARLRAKCKAAGRELKQGDAWIAATALSLDCPLASDDNDFREVPGIESGFVLIRRPR